MHIKKTNPDLSLSVSSMYTECALLTVSLTGGNGRVVHPPLASSVIRNWDLKWQVPVFMVDVYG